MKKILLTVFAMGMLFAFSSSAFAFDVTFGGRVRTDFGYNYTSEEGTENGTDSIIRGFFNVASSSYLRATFSSKDKKVGVRIEMGQGSTITRRTVFGWYQIGNCKIVAGNNYTWAGDTVIGHSSWLTDLTTNGIGLQYFGRMPMIALEWQSGNFGVQVGIFEPQDDGIGSNAMDFGWYLPQVHVTGDLKFAMFQLAPSIAVVNYQWETGTGGGDSSYTAYNVALPVTAAFGPVTITANGFYSVNGANDFGSNPYDDVVVKANGDIENSRSYGGFLEVAYKTGPVKLAGGFGGVLIENDEWTETNGWADDSTTQFKAYVTMDYKLHANLTLRPEIGYYDKGDSPETGNEAGNEWLFGLRFQFVF
jgi:hypothetical protein